MTINHNNFNHFQLWETQVGSDSFELERQVQQMLGESELYRLANTSNLKKQREYLLSRFLIRHSLSAYFTKPLDHWRISEQDKSPPYIENLPSPLFFSISHSHGLIQFAISKKSIGIDIEKIRPKSNLMEISKLVMCKTEFETMLVQSDDQKLGYFYRIWSSKEAFYKTLCEKSQKSTRFSEIDVAKAVNDKRIELFDIGSSEFSNVIVINTRLK